MTAFDETLAEMQAAGFLPGGAPTTPETRPPVPGARRGRDEAGQEAWYVPDPDRPGKYLRVDLEAAPKCLSATNRACG